MLSCKAPVRLHRVRANPYNLGIELAEFFVIVPEGAGFLGTPRGVVFGVEEQNGGLRGYCFPAIEPPDPVAAFRVQAGEHLWRYELRNLLVGVGLVHIVADEVAYDGRRPNFLACWRPHSLCSEGFLDSAQRPTFDSCHVEDALDDPHFLLVYLVAVPRNIQPEAVIH